MTQSGETGVIVAVPAADALVTAWRLRYDTSAPLGVPPHVTLVYPWVSRSAMTGRDLTDLADLVAEFQPFSMQLRGTARFAGEPGVLYLAPEPADVFRALTAAIVRRWPEHPPYEGAHADPIPHLTVTETAAEATMAEIEQVLRSRLPLSAEVTQAQLMEFDGRRWQLVARLPFGA